MKHVNPDRRVLMAGVGGALAGSLLASTGRAAPADNSPTAQSLQQISDKIALAGSIAQPLIPLSSVAGNSAAAHVITADGAYFCTHNERVADGLSGILVQADNVSIDFCGFNLYGGSGGAAGKPGGTGIYSDRANTCVFDASIIGFDQAVNVEKAQAFVLIDIIAMNPSRCGFALGNRGQGYDLEVYNSAVGYSLSGMGSILEECGAWHCNLGVWCIGTQNLIISNTANQCNTPFEIGQGNSYGPIANVSGVGDLSLVPATLNPSANYVF